MKKHRQEHEEMLRDWLLDEDRHALPEPLADCAACTAEAAELRAELWLLDRAGRYEREDLERLGSEPEEPGDARVDALLAEVARREREDLDRSEAEPEEPGDARVERILADLAAGRPDSPADRPAQRHPWTFAVVAAAAAVLAFGLARWLDRPEPPRTGDASPHDVMLGDGFQLLTPIGEVEAFRAFAWTYDGQAPYGFELRIYDAGDADVPVLSEELPADQTSWTPSDDERASLPKRLLWEVTVRNALGQPAAGDPTSGRASSSLSGS